MEWLSSNNTIVAAVLGAAVTVFAGSLFQYWHRFRILRRDTVGELSAYSFESIAVLLEYYSARIDSSNKPNEKMYLAKLKRIQGKGAQLEMQLWHVFKERRVRAGFNKLLRRIDKVSTLLSKETVPNSKEINLAFSWIEEQSSEALKFASEVSGTKMTDPGRIMFLGFNPWKWEENKKIFSFDDVAPPWECDVSIEFPKNPLNNDAKAGLLKNIKKKIEKKRCSIHGGAAHVTVAGRGPQRIRVQVVGCCNEFANYIDSQITINANSKG